MIPNKEIQYIYGRIKSKCRSQEWSDDYESSRAIRNDLKRDDLKLILIDLNLNASNQMNAMCPYNELLPT